MSIPLASADTAAEILSWAKQRAKHPSPLTTEETIVYAHAWARAGVYVVVCAPGTKIPTDYRTDDQRASDHGAGQTRSGCYLGTRDPERLTSYITEAVRRTRHVPNLAAHLGPARMVVVDADNEGDVIEWRRYAYNTYRHDCVPTTLSPGKINDAGQWEHRDGAHFWYRLPADAEVREVSELRVLGHLEPDSGIRAGWEIKANAKIVVLPLAVRKEGRYVPFAADIPAAPGWLVDIMGKPEVAPKPPRTEEDMEFSADVDDALDDVPWQEVFEGVAMHTGEDPDGCTVWQRHGGSPRSMVAHDGCAAAHGSTVVTVHSDTILTQYPLLDELYDKRGVKNFSKWECLAAFQHDGNMSAVAKAHGFARTVADFSNVFAPPGSPFTVVRPRVQPENACPHGSNPKLCLPCLRARRASLNTSPNGVAQ